MRPSPSPRLTTLARLTTFASLTTLAAIACSSGDKGSAEKGSEGAASTAAVDCPEPQTGITLPDGFCATVFADSIGHARHIAVAPNGDVYVNTWSGQYYGNTPVPKGGFLVALRDTNRDGRADVIQRFGDSTANRGTGGTGLFIHGGAVYAEAGPRIVRYALDGQSLVPTAPPDTVVTDLPLSGDHPQHAMAIDLSGALFMESGSASNSCQIKERTLESKGKDPCLELQTRGGIWRFDAAGKKQKFSPSQRWATGIRNAVGMTIGPDGGLWATQHGRDQLAENWPQLYKPQQGQELPAEVLLRVEKGDDFGWPYCYWDGSQNKLVLAPEYEGDGGKAVGRCADKKGPVAAFPAHWAPNGVVFYTGENFPAKYRGGAFIAFHGSWNRTPGPQGGYNVVFQPMADGKANGAYEVFANGFAGGNMQPDRATFRPVGVTMGGDGALYVTDDRVGRVWRITYAAK